MPENSLVSAEHRGHALEWRSGDTCLLCLMNILQGQSSKIHKRFAMSTLMQRLCADPAVTQRRQDLVAQKDLTWLLQTNKTVAIKLLQCLLGKFKFNFQF